MTEPPIEPPAGKRPPKLVLRLYVTGSSPRSLRAVANLKQFVDELLEGTAQLDVIDIYQDPEAAKKAQIVASPTLIKEHPLPIQRVLGDLSDRRKLAAVLAIDVEEASDWP